MSEFQTSAMTADFYYFEVLTLRGLTLLTVWVRGLGCKSNAHAENLTEKTTVSV